MSVQTDFVKCETGIHVISRKTLFIPDSGWYH